MRDMTTLQKTNVRTRQVRRAVVLLELEGEIPTIAEPAVETVFLSFGEGTKWTQAFLLEGDSLSEIDRIVGQEIALSGPQGEAPTTAAYFQEQPSEAGYVGELLTRAQEWLKGRIPG